MLSLFNQQKIKTNPIKSDKNKVTVRIWLGSKGKSLLGHASLQTHSGGSTGKGIEASYWPGGCHRDSCNEKKSHFHHFNQDLREEEHPPDNTIVLDGLNSEAINKSFEEIKKNKYEWALTGSSIFRKTNSNNCSGLCYILLAKGGAILPDYPMADFYEHIFLLYILSHELIKTKRNFPRRLTYGLWKYSLYIPGPRWWGALNELFSININRNLLSISFLISAFSILRMISKRGGGFRIIFIASLITLSRYFIFTKTITPRDIETIAEYNKKIENGNAKKLLSHYWLTEYGLITRQNINNLIMIATSIGASIEIFHKKRGDVPTKMSRASAWGATTAINSYIARDIRVLLAAFIGCMPFIIKRFRAGAGGLIGDTYSAITILCDVRVFPQYAFTAPILFYLADKLNEKIKLKTNSLNQGKSTFYEKTLQFIDKYNLIPIATFTAAITIGFFSVKKLKFDLNALASEETQGSVLETSLKNYRSFFRR